MLLFSSSKTVAATNLFNNHTEHKWFDSFWLPHNVSRWLENRFLVPSEYPSWFRSKISLCSGMLGKFRKAEKQEEEMADLAWMEIIKNKYIDVDKRENYEGIASIAMNGKEYRRISKGSANETIFYYCSVSAGYKNYALGYSIRCRTSY